MLEHGLVNGHSAETPLDELLADAASDHAISAGHDAGSRGLPKTNDLPLAVRALVAASATADIGLRTAAASLVAGSMLPLTVNPRWIRRELDRVQFYAELAAAKDATASFPAPTAHPLVRRRGAGSLRFRFDDGFVEQLSFESPFRAVNPAMRETYASFRRNRIAHAQHWRHDDGPRPTLTVIHGFMGSPYLLNGAFFSLPWFYRAGYDILLFTLPFHGPRQERKSPYSGHGYFAHGLGVLAEAMAHAVHDLRVFIAHLRSSGVEQIGVTGMSLGGYTTALLAATEPGLAVAIPNVPVADLVSIVDDWFPAGAMLQLARRAGRIDQEALGRVFSFHSPLNYEPLVPKERRFIICGLGDRLAPPRQSELLWEHWGRCKFHWFPGNHVLHLNQSAYLRRMARFMRGHGFAPSSWLGDEPNRETAATICTSGHADQAR